jgi:hypothetical protein
MNVDIWDQAYKNQGALVVMALLLVFIAMSVATFAQRISNRKIKAAIDNLGARETIIAHLNRGATESYFTSLESVIECSGKVYGQKMVSWRTYGTCLTVALFYPLIAIIMGWLFFNIWSPAGIDIFRDIESNIGRLWRFLLLVSSIIFAFMIVKNNDALSQYFAAKLSQKMPKLVGPNTKMDRVGLETLVGGIAIVFAISVALTVAAMFPGTFTGSIAVAVAVAVAGAFAAAISVDRTFAAAVVGGFGVAGNAAAAAAIAVVGDIEIATLHLLLYAFLPLLNAGTDMFSLWITCAFLKRTSANRSRPWQVLVRIFVDLCLAVLCFIGLIVLLWAILAFWGWISPTTVPLDLRAYWTGVQADPRTGVALYLMAMTTLIPTLIHITVGLGAILPQRSVSLLRMAIELTQKPSDLSFSAEHIAIQKRTLDQATYWGHFRAALVVGLICAPVLMRC